jgi:hypothetical protein
MSSCTLSYRDSREEIYYNHQPQFTQRLCVKLGFEPLSLGEGLG